MTTEESHRLICPVCSSEIYWTSSFDGSEIDPERYYDDDDSIISEYSCPHCGTDLFAYMPPVSERSSYPFWQDRSGDKE